MTWGIPAAPLQYEEILRWPDPRMDDYEIVAWYSDGMPMPNAVVRKGEVPR